MIKIGITGSLASGKTTASKILSFRRGPLFSADKVVKNLYRNKRFKSLVSKKFKIKNNNQLKKSIKKLILKNTKYKKIRENNTSISKKKMRDFTLQNRNKKFLFYEIPLLIENRLMKHFNLVFFIKANKKTRLKRFQLKNGDKLLFDLLNNKQMKDKRKIKFCDYVVVNEKNLNILKKNLLAIMSKHE